jgi:hypothetical protein
MGPTSGTLESRRRFLVPVSVGGHSLALLQDGTLSFVTIFGGEPADSIYSPNASYYAANAPWNPHGGSVSIVDLTNLSYAPLSNAGYVDGSVTWTPWASVFCNVVIDVGGGSSGLIFEVTYITYTVPSGSQIQNCTATGDGILNVSVPIGSSIAVRRLADGQDSNNGDGPVYIDPVQYVVAGNYPTISLASFFEAVPVPRTDITVFADIAYDNQQLYVQQSGKVTPFTMSGSYGSTLDYTLEGFDHTWYYVYTSVGILDNAPFTITDAQGMPLANVGEINLFNGWSFIGGSPLPPDPEHFTIQIPEARSSHTILFVEGNPPYPGGDAVGQGTIVESTYYDPWHFADVPTTYREIKIDTQPVTYRPCVDAF